MKQIMTILSLSFLTLTGSMLFGMDLKKVPSEWRKLFKNSEKLQSDCMNGFKIVGFQNDTENPITLIRSSSEPIDSLKKNKYSKSMSCVVSTQGIQEVRTIKPGPFFFDSNELVIKGQPFCFFQIIAGNKILRVKIDLKKNQVKSKGETQTFTDNDEMILHVSKEGEVRFLNRKTSRPLVQLSYAKNLHRIIKNTKEELPELPDNLYQSIAYYAALNTFNPQIIIDKVINDTLTLEEIEQYVHDLLDYLGEQKAQALCNAFDEYFRNRKEFNSNGDSKAKAKIIELLKNK